MRHLFALCLISLAGCAVSGQPPSTYSTSTAPPPPQVKMKHDDSLKLTTWEGANCASERMDALFLRAVKSDDEKAPPTSYVIYVSDGYAGESLHSYFRADDSDGNSLPLHQVDRFVINCTEHFCTYTEDFTLAVSKAYLIQHQNSGIRLQLTGQRGNEVFEMPGNYIQTFLAQVP